jgi:hypothetical protein
MIASFLYYSGAPQTAAPDPILPAIIQAMQEGALSGLTVTRRQNGQGNTMVALSRYNAATKNYGDVCLRDLVSLLEVRPNKETLTIFREVYPGPASPTRDSPACRVASLVLSDPRLKSWLAGDYDFSVSASRDNYSMGVSKLVGPVGSFFIVVVTKDFKIKKFIAGK